MTLPLQLESDQAAQLDLWGERLNHLRRLLEDRTDHESIRLRRDLRRLEGRRESLRARVLHAAHGDRSIEWEHVRENLERALEDFRTLGDSVLRRAEESL